MSQNRPELTAGVTGAELLRWYWLQVELSRFARTLGVGSAGGKQQLTARIVARLDGRSPSVETASRPPPAAALPEPLTGATRIPAGQRCTQQLRRYFVGQIGSCFRFDAAMRAFLATGEGSTLGQAVEHWHATRSVGRPEIGGQFELNRFLRDWHRRHPAGSPVDARAAWRLHRGQPVDARPDAVDEAGKTGAAIERYWPDAGFLS